MYGCNDFIEVQAKEIAIIDNYKDVVSISLTICICNFLDQYIHVTHSISPLKLRRGMEC